MRVEWATFAQAVTGPGTTPTLHEVGFNRATVDHLPFEIPLLVLVRYVTPPHDLGREAKITVEVADPELNVIQSAGGTVIPTEPPNWIEGWETRNWHPVQIELRAEQEGVYTVRIRVDDALGWELPFRVELANPPNLSA